MSKSLNLAYYRPWLVILSFDGNNEMKFDDVVETNYPHYGGMALGSYQGSAFITGSFRLNSPHRRTEILNYAAEQWEVVDDYPVLPEHKDYHIE